MSSVRDTYRWQQLRAQVIRRAKVAGSPCGLCHYPIAFDAPARSPYSPSVDHVVPLSLGGAAFELDNLRCVHSSCNASAGARLPRRRRASADWLGEPRMTRTTRNW